jgi:hypothetical protein
VSDLPRVASSSRANIVALLLPGRPIVSSYIDTLNLLANNRQAILSRRVLLTEYPVSSTVFTVHSRLALGSASKHESAAKGKRRYANGRYLVRRGQYRMRPSWKP